VKLSKAAFDEAEFVSLVTRAGIDAQFRPPGVSEREWAYRTAISEAEDFEMLSPFRQIEAAVEREVAADTAGENIGLDEE